MIGVGGVKIGLGAGLTTLFLGPLLIVMPVEITGGNIGGAGGSGGVTLGGLTLGGGGITIGGGVIGLLAVLVDTFALTGTLTILIGFGVGCILFNLFSFTADEADNPICAPRTLPPLLLAGGLVLIFFPLLLNPIIKIHSYFQMG